MKAIVSNQGPVLSAGIHNTDNNSSASSVAVSPDGVFTPPFRWIQHGNAVGGRKLLLLGCAGSGAKFTPENHAATGNRVLDAILQGAYIPVKLEDILKENEILYAEGVRYFHWHARNPVTREQSCDSTLYRLFGQWQRQQNPGLALSYGGSRNGREINAALKAGGEWSRLAHTALPRHEGGADFVTIQAAAELMIILDLERQGYIRSRPENHDYEILRPLAGYVASRVAESVSLEAYSTAGGGKYGAGSCAGILRALSRSISARNYLGLPQEVEWTQLDRSYGLTKLLLQQLKPGLGDTGRLNLTILFGFSPKLPFPQTYAEFRNVVGLARSLEQLDHFPELHLTVSVGAAILPQQVANHISPLDIGPYRGTPVPPLERLAAYACQPDSGIDLLRFGIEDHPFLLDEKNNIIPATNVDLMHYTLEAIEKHGGQIATSPITVRQFVSAENRPWVDRIV